MTEAEKPRTYAEHLQRAEETYGRLCAFVRDAKGLPDLEGKLNQLRTSAAKGFWLYPVVEARRGIPR
jgi:hypothetical protein